MGEGRLGPTLTSRPREALPARVLASWVSHKILFEPMALLLKEQPGIYWTVGRQDLWLKGPAQT